MAWLDYHLHDFELVNPSTGSKVEIGIPDEGFDGDKGVLCYTNVALSVLL